MRNIIFIIKDPIKLDTQRWIQTKLTTLEAYNLDMSDLNG